MERPVLDCGLSGDDILIPNRGWQVVIAAYRIYSVSERLNMICLHMCFVRGYRLKWGWQHSENTYNLRA